MKEKLIVILGQTATGKSDLSVKLALRLRSGQAKKKFGIDGAEIISADSRQVYKGMDIGTGKITKKEMKRIPHYLLSVVSPKKRFTVAQYQKLAQKEISKIFNKNKVPLLVGGTGFYIRAVVDGISFPKVRPDWKLRKKLERKSTDSLFKMLKKLDKRRTKNIDRNNRRRLIRAIEIVKKTKEPIPPLQKEMPKFELLLIGIKKSPQELKKLIKRRFQKRLRKGMIAEVKRLRNSGLSWKKLEDFGLEYKYIALYLQKKLSYEEMAEKLQKEIEHFSKRQMTWFKKDKRTHWIKNFQQAEKLIKRFLSK